MAEPRKKSVLFFRNFLGPAGGHLKVWHYFTHVQASRTHIPQIFFTEKSLWNDSNPWQQIPETARAKSWAPGEADALFIGGVDWRALPEAFRNEPPVPILNIVQGLSHAKPEDPKYAFLRHRAIRICVNPLLEQTLRAVPHLNGPLFSIPMGLDHGGLPQPRGDRFDVVIAAMKAPGAGRGIAARLRRPGRRVALLETALPRQDYLQMIADSRVAVLLPLRLEGFYLPMLEAMAMGRIAVCPDCVANRAYCIPGGNGFLPDYTAAAIAEATECALALSPKERQVMSGNAVQTAAGYTLARERAAFQKLLGNLDDIWHG